MSNYIQISFGKLNQEHTDILIASLAENGYEGFEETDHELKAFIAEENFNESLLQQLMSFYEADFSKTLIPVQNWNRSWESNFDPVIIDDFVAIRAEFHAPVDFVKHEILITPKMSFGTGHHATTAMMIKHMKEIDFAGKTVFDFGTGTGILAILAEKLGALRVLAIDNDDWSIENASENIQKNNCSVTELKKASAISGATGYDIILANITKNIILENFRLITQQLNKNGILVLSGLLADDEADILRYSGGIPLQLSGKLQEGNWLSLRFLR
jgi:ribosomal protein L11 methyltransferase